jgi:CDP-6-deoxy-D-xylo-4-hexulose-3-dehydrase|tara:strand:+ start:11207 stop:12373 length:1167 start_codon:yes stop_codon:yes gene_type:complete
MKIPLVKDTINSHDIDKLVQWLGTYPRLTKGEKTLEFEDEWSKFMGSKHSVFVNSGSSANLLMLYSLLEAKLVKKGSPIIVPAVSWSTDLAPVVQLGFEPILCDCNLDDLSIDLSHFEDLCEKYNPSALILVSVLGLVPNMKRIQDICKKHNVLLLEDSCESFGSKYKQKNLGTFGLMGTFSTYFGHHLSTIEGGVIVTDDSKIFNILKSIRSHGWDRDMDPIFQKKLRSRHDVGDFENLYKFYHFGFNVRSTDLNAFIGLGQLERASYICQKRKENYDLYEKEIDNQFWKPEKKKDCYVSNFSYPIISKNRDEIVSSLKQGSVEVRPLVCGSLAKQPIWYENYTPVDLPNADIVDKYGLYIPNNHEMTNQQIKYISNIINPLLKEAR